MGRFAIFIIVINIGFIVLVEIMVEVRNLIMKMIWGREKFEVYRTWERARSRNPRQVRNLFRQTENLRDPHNKTITVNPESVKGPLFSTLITAIILIFIQAYLMARFTLFYHGLTGYTFLPLVLVASIVSLLIHLSARHGWITISILLSSYLLIGVLLYR